MWVFFSPEKFCHTHGTGGKEEGRKRKEEERGRKRKEEEGDMKEEDVGRQGRKEGVKGRREGKRRRERKEGEATYNKGLVLAQPGVKMTAQCAKGDP